MHNFLPLLQGPPGAAGAEGRQGEKGAKVSLLFFHIIEIAYCFQYFVVSASCRN